MSREMKFRSLFIPFLLIFSFSVFGQKGYLELVSPTLLREDLQIVKENLEQVHPGLYRYNSKEEFEAFYQKLQSEINTSVSSIEFYRKLLPLLSLIANNHTKIQCPKSYDSAISQELPRIPFRLYPKGNKLYTHEDLSREQEIGAGKEIISIDGVNSEELLKRMITKTSLDGQNTSFAYYGIGLAFSRKYAYYFGTKDVYQVDYVDHKGETKTVSIKGIKASEINKKRILLRTEESESLQLQIKEGIGYLKVTSFQPESEKKFKKQISRHFSTIQRNSIKRLIIDVRDNGGGFGELAAYILSYLISEPIHPYKDEYALVDKIPNPEYYDKDIFFKHFKSQRLVKKGKTYHIKNIASQKIRPNKNGFKGELFILMNGGSASATGEFLGLVKSYTNAVFFGEEAGGNPIEIAANDLLTLVLPNSNIRITIPALRTIVNTNFENQGFGVQPDHEIIPSIQDIINGKDPVLDFALKKIKE